MRDPTAKHHMRDKQKIPRIERKDAARIFARLEHLTDNPDDPEMGKNFDQFVAQLEEPILQLSVQPDSWGERTRARLVSFIMGIKGIPAESANAAEIVEASNVMMPCFLLELGKRKRNIVVDFPTDPCGPRARFGLSVSPSRPMHWISSEQLKRLVTDLGEDLVGLCYFGDRQSRNNIEAELSRDDAGANSPTPRCRTLSSSSPKPKR
jgi:hypothetical protein